MQAMRSAFLAQQKKPDAAPSPDAPADDVGTPDASEGMQPYKLDGSELKQLLTSGTVQCTLSDGETVTLDVDENDATVQALKQCVADNSDEETNVEQDPSSGDDHGAY